MYTKQIEDTLINVFLFWYFLIHTYINSENISVKGEEKETSNLINQYYFLSVLPNSIFITLSWIELYSPILQIGKLRFNDTE